MRLGRIWNSQFVSDTLGELNLGRREEPVTGGVGVDGATNGCDGDAHDAAVEGGFLLMSGGQNCCANESM